MGQNPRRPISGATIAVPAPGLWGRLAGLPDHRMLDRLLRSRAWIWVMGIALGGIVAMQVSMLKLNTGISRAVEASATLERANAGLEEEVAGLSSGDRIRTEATRLGLIMPEAGSVGYLTVRPGFDERRALRRMTAPSDDARALLASGGRAPDALVGAATAALTTPVAPTTPTTTTTEAQPGATAAPTAPVATATPAPPAATATPAPVVTAAPADPAAQQTQGVTGAAAAPAGE